MAVVGGVYAVCLLAVIAFVLAPATVDLTVGKSGDAAAPISGWVESKQDSREEFLDRTAPIQVRLGLSGLNGAFSSSGVELLNLSGTVRKAGIPLAMVYASGRKVSIEGGWASVSVLTGSQ